MAKDGFHGETNPPYQTVIASGAMTRRFEPFQRMSSPLATPLTRSVQVPKFAASVVW